MATPTRNPKTSTRNQQIEQTRKRIKLNLTLAPETIDLLNKTSTRTQIPISRLIEDLVHTHQEYLNSLPSLKSI